MRKNFSTTGLNFVVKLFRRNFISLFSAFFTKNFSPTYLITLPQTVNHSLCVCNFWQHFVESEKYREILSKLKMLDDQCCQTEIFRNRQFWLWDSPKSPFLEPKIAEISPHFQQIFTTFCPGWPFLFHFYVTIFSKTFQEKIIFWKIVT